MNIIDCHSHIGNDWSWGKASLEGYLCLLEKTGIDTALLMPVPGQLDLKNNKRLLVFDGDRELLNYYNELDRTKPNSRLLNDPIREIILNYNGNKKLYFVPYIHPILDDPNYLYELASLYNPVAFKIHGVVHGVTLNMFGKEFIKALQSINIPVIAHTDISLETNSLKGYIKDQNSSLRWARFFVEYGIKGYITHAARLDNETFDLINKNGNLVVGIGPDLLLIKNPTGLIGLNRFAKKDILSILYNNVDSNKIMFDVDYSWNVIDEEKDLDYGMVERVNSVFPEKDKQKILKSNAIRFFRL